MLNNANLQQSQNNIFKLLHPVASREIRCLQSPQFTCSNFVFPDMSKAEIFVSQQDKDVSSEKPDRSNEEEI